MTKSDTLTEPGEVAIPSPPYAEPYYDDRTWTPPAEAEDWERLMYAALRRGLIDSVAGILADLEKAPQWRRQPYLHRVFGPPARPATFPADILAADRDQLRRWRQLREVAAKRYDVARSQELLDRLAEREEHTWQYLASLREDVLTGFAAVEGYLTYIKHAAAAYFDPDATQPFALEPES